MFVEREKPKDYDCGYNMEMLIQALPRIEEKSERVKYAKRAVGLIKQSHPSWVDEDDNSKAAWDHFFELAEYDPNDYGIRNPFDQ